MLALSLLIGVIAVVMMARWMNEKAALSTTGVVVAARDIPLGTRLAPEQLKVVAWPSGSKPSGTFNDIQKVNTRVLNASVQVGEPVLESRLAPIGSKGGLSALIPEGKRAVSVKVKEESGVAGFALPGNYVDVLVSAQDENGRPISRIVLQRILVLAIAQEANRDETKPKLVNAVTLEVTPAEAEQLDLARSIGQLSLALRNQVDMADAATGGAHLSDLVRGSSHLEPQPAPAATDVATVPAPEIVVVKPVPRHKSRAVIVKSPVKTEKSEQPPARPSYVEGVQVGE
ncbi:MAG: Flp pilus assembly protein CpaB [bacterium]|nr:Flp pilus assembly protein CpaB [bacterium]